eukprot:jgi/Bigna1/88009/estExt_fgenesh1_pg.C_270044
MPVSISPALKTQMIAPSPATHASKIPSQSVLSGTHADLTTDRNRTSSRTCGSCRSPILPHLPTFMYNDEAFCSYDCRVRAYQLDCAARKIKKWKDESKNNRTKAQRTRRKRSDGRKNHQKKRCNDKNNGNNILAMPQCITDSPRDPKKLPVVRSKSVSTPYSQLPPIESITSSSVQSFNPLYRRDEQAISRMRPQKLPEFVSATIVSRKGSEHMTHLGFSTILIQLQQGIPSEYLGSVTACTIKHLAFPTGRISPPKAVPARSTSFRQQSDTVVESDPDRGFNKNASGSEVQRRRGDVPSDKKGRTVDPNTFGSI